MFNFDHHGQYDISDYRPLFDVMHTVSFLSRIDQDMFYLNLIVNKINIKSLITKCLMEAYSANESPEDDPMRNNINLAVISDCAKFIGFLAMSEDDTFLDNLFK